MNLIKYILTILGAFSSIQFCYSQNFPLELNNYGRSFIHNLIFSSDGKKLISISEDKTIRIWDVQSGAEIQKYESERGNGPEGMFYASAISPDGKLLAVAGYPVSTQKENYVIVIDIDKGKQVATAIGHTDIINSLSFSGSGDYLASGSADGTVHIWKMENFPTLISSTLLNVGLPVTNLNFNRITQDLAVAVDSKDILVFALAGLRKGEKQFTPKSLQKHKGILNELAYSPDGGYLISSSYENELMLWTSHGTFVKEIDKIKHPITALAFSFDGKILTALDETGKGMTYSIPTLAILSEFNGHDNTSFGVAFSPSMTGSNYIVASSGGNNKEIILWDPLTGNTIRKFQTHGSAIRGLHFGEGYELFISREWELNNNELIYTNSFDFSSFIIKQNPKVPSIPRPPQNIFQTGINTLSLPEGKIIQTNESDGRILHYITLADGGVLVASDFTLKLFNKSGKLIKEFIGHSGPVRGCTISADGKYMASGSEDQSIILWNLTESANTITPFIRLHIDSNDVDWICWSDNGYFASTIKGGQSFGWHFNRGIHQLADFYTADQYFNVLYKPKELKESVYTGKRIESIIRESGEELFDPKKILRPSVGFFLKPIGVDELRQDGQPKFYTKSKNISLSVEVFDGGGGIEEINIFQNDKLIIQDKSLQSLKIDSFRKEYPVEMLNEENEFRIKVINKQKIESKPNIMIIEYNGEIINRTSLYLFVIGINEYANSNYSLNYARPDAESIVKKFRQKSSSLFKTFNIKELYDAEATKENILKSFNELSETIKQEDVFLFYYAGHGVLSEENTDDYYLVPSNVTQLYGNSMQLKSKGVSTNELKEMLTSVKAQKQVIFLDACQSGGAIKALAMRQAAIDERAIMQLARSSGVTLLASSGSQQYAAEFEELKHGVFTYALLEAIDGQGDNGDNKVTVTELKTYLDERVPILTKQYGGKAQYPAGFMVGNDFPLAIIVK